MIIVRALLVAVATAVVVTSGRAVVEAGAYAAVVFVIALLALYLSVRSARHPTSRAAGLYAAASGLVAFFSLSSAFGLAAEAYDASESLLWPMWVGLLGVLVGLIAVLIFPAQGEPTS